MGRIPINPPIDMPAVKRYNRLSLRIEDESGGSEAASDLFIGTENRDACNQPTPDP